MSTPLRATVDRLFAAFEAKDEAAVLALLADDAVLIDPHYPTPRMAGKTAIAEGLRWAFGAMKTLRFSIVTYGESEDGQTAVVEVDTAHMLKTGLPLKFPQAFIVDTREGVVTRVRAYTPYGPGGMGGLILRVIRVWRRLRGPASR